VDGSRGCSESSPGPAVPVAAVGSTARLGELRRRNSSDFSSLKITNLKEAMPGSLARWLWAWGPITDENYTYLRPCTSCFINVWMSVRGGGSGRGEPSWPFPLTSIPVRAVRPCSPCQCGCGVRADPVYNCVVYKRRRFCS